MARLNASTRRKTGLRTAFAGANLTPDERHELERRAKASGRRLSDYIRLALLSDRPGAATQARLPGDVGRKLAAELARIGNNLNQLAYHANATGSLPARNAIDTTLNEIVRATEALTLL